MDDMDNNNLLKKGKEREEQQQQKKPLLCSIYNFKGGVGKTTATYNIGYILSEVMGLTVLMVDADPQSNLTGLIYAEDFIDVEKSEKFYKKAEDQGKKNPPVLTTMREIFKDMLKQEQPKDLAIIEYVKLSKVQNYENLYLIPGHLTMADMDRQVGLGVEGIGLYKNYPGYISNLFRKIGEKNNIDVILFDLNPSFGDFNGSIIIGSDYFCLPFSADIFSLQAMQSLQRRIPEWYRSIHDRDDKRDEIGVINTRPRILGAYPQKVRIRKVQNKDEIAVEEAYASWITRIYAEAEKLFNILKKENMCADTAKFTKVEGVIDFVSVGFDVQLSGRPICDKNFPHKHQKSETETVRLTTDQQNKKSQAFNSYQKIIGRLFMNLSLEHREMLGKSSRNFIEKLACYHELNVGFEANVYLQVPQTPDLPEEDQHWYTNDEINALMEHYFANKENIVYHRAVSSTHLSEVKHSLETLRKQTNSGKINKGLIPVNLDNNHWAMLYIIYEQNNTNPNIYYFDPLGYDIPAVITKQIREVYAGLDSQSLDERVQNDHYNCGPWIIEAGRSLCFRGSFPPLGFDINATRIEHRRVISDYEEIHSSRQKKKQKLNEYESQPSQKTSKASSSQYILRKRKEAGETNKKYQSANLNNMFAKISTGSENNTKYSQKESSLKPNQTQ